MTINHKSTDNNHTTAQDDDDRPGHHHHHHHHHSGHDPIIFKLGNLVTFKLSQLKYFTFTMIGIALLWPWNCFLSASEYYAERFLNTPSLIKVYSSTMMSVSTITSMVYNFYLSQTQSNVNYNYRVNTGLSITIGIFLIMAFSCISDWFIKMNDTAFFTILMFMVLLSAMATCLAQNGTMAIVNVMGGIYANAVMVGQAVAGVLPATALIISVLTLGDKTVTPQEYIEKNFGVFAYYITASLVSICSILLLYWTSYHKNEIAYETLNRLMEEGSAQAEAEESESIDDDEYIEPIHKQKKYVSFALLWSKLNYIVMTIFLTFSITLIFPVFAATVESTHTNSNFKLFHKSIFIPFIYLVWNMGDLLGRILCGYPTLKMLIKDPKVLIVYSISRLIFIPLFLTCNVHPKNARALINSDLWYITLQFLFGLSNGQLCTSSFMIIGEYCDNDDEKEAAGGFSVVFLSVGLAFGSIFSYLLVLFIA
ncbi:uncharacterized protein J8A68_001182 [[Candida] subhashii]|uniref:Nucleoside transporter FUN26 n=1 Tax=[Candida] subhashii TaxID=561895 RepID=A0A8J5QR29_9ASCO|nr:uncharacterized protein J8A68_001182 [[Candida] subhashii]KAG7665126.1 hypothetical protein J8A68_001182 [[Candida] subhashii]